MSKSFELDLSKVEFSSNDLRSGIKIPKFLTNDLCYETGTHIGDGHLSCYRRPGSFLYQVAYSGDLKNEYDFYSRIMVPLLKGLYNKEFSIRKSTKNTLQILMGSKAIVTFKLNSLGLPNRAKIGKVRIPGVIVDSSLELRKACLGGIVDTDFSLVFRHGKYPKITGEIPSENVLLVNQIQEILDEIGIKYNCSSYKRTDNRFRKKSYTDYKLDINGRDNLDKWMGEIGFRSPKHLVKLELWKKYGFCKPFLSYNQREKLVNAPR